MLAVESEERRNVDIADSVTIGEKERLGVDVFARLVQTGAGCGFSSGLRERDFPVLVASLVVKLRGLTAVRRQSKVAVHLALAQKILFDLPTFVA